jgi:hypothetical protein
MTGDRKQAAALKTGSCLAIKLVAYRWMQQRQQNGAPGKIRAPARACR